MKNKQNRKNRTKGKVIDFYTGREITKPVINKFSESAFQFAKSILWFNKEIDAEEEMVCKDSIKIYFLKNNHRKMEAFIEFCERVVLAKWYVQAYTHRYIPTPAVWFNMNYKKGFVGTELWLDILEAKRKANPLHHVGLKMFAISYLEYVLHPTKDSYNQGRAILMELKEFSLLNLLLEWFSLY